MTESKFLSEVYPFNFWETLDKSILEQPPRTSTEVSLHPSEASALAIGEDGGYVSLGACLRKTWFRNKLQRQMINNEFATKQNLVIDKQEFTPQELWKFKISSYTENAITDEAKRAMVYSENSRKFRWYIPTLHQNLPDALISGEVDLVTYQSPESGVKVGVEIKSITGFKGMKQVFGHRKKGGIYVPPEPKEDNLLQTVLYAYFFCVLQQEMAYFKLVYLSRENGSRVEFDIDLIPEVSVSLGRVQHRVYVNKKPYKHTLYAEDILRRYMSAHKFIHLDLIPPRDYDFFYSEEKIKELYESGSLNKTDSEKASKDKFSQIKIGDWQCRYCPFSNMCYSADAKKTPIEYPDGKVQGEIIYQDVSEVEETTEE